MAKVYSKTTFVTVNQLNTANIGYLGANSKTTFVTVNRYQLQLKLSMCQNSKTTFVTVNQGIAIDIAYGMSKFKNNFCYC